MKISESLAFKKLSENEYETLHPPIRQGNSLNIAYGGYALAVACKATVLSVPEGYRIYSLMGNYIGPALTDRPLRASVRIIRQTRSFATRQVELTQAQDDGKRRICMLAMADFQIPEKETLMQYSRPPLRQYSHYSTIPTAQDLHDKLLRDGKITAEQHAFATASFSAFLSIFDTRLCPEGIFSQNLYGIAKTLPTTQDSEPIYRRTTANWERFKETLESTADQVAALTFSTDAGIGLIPLSFSHMYMEDVSACASLDFALRFFTNDVDLSKWHLREIQTTVGAHGRTFGEMWMWDEHGNAIANMSQQSILRPKSKKEKL